MLGNKTPQWVEEYLYSARGHRALEQSVFAEGERHGFSERKLRHAAETLGVTASGGCWELSPLRAEALDARMVLALGGQTAPLASRRLPSVGYIGSAQPIRARRAA
jgi:hypothetical protein